MNQCMNLVEFDLFIKVTEMTLTMWDKAAGQVALISSEGMAHVYQYDSLTVMFCFLETVKATSA